MEKIYSEMMVMTMRIIDLRGLPENTYDKMEAASGVMFKWSLSVAKYTRFPSILCEANCSHNAVKSIQTTAQVNMDAPGLVVMSRKFMSGDLSSSGEFSVNDVVS